MPHRSKNAGPANHKFIARGAEGEKTCTKCRRLRPLTEFNRDATRFDGCGYVCAECRTKGRTKPGPTIRERRARRTVGLAWCNGCDRWFTVDKVHAGVCQPCANAEMRRRYRIDPAFRFRRQQRSLARKRSLEPIPYYAAEMILEEFRGCCAYCGAAATTWDHVVPVVKGGLTEPYNIVPACRPCNSSKRSGNLWIWLTATGRTPSDLLIERLSLYHTSLFMAGGPNPFE